MLFQPIDIAETLRQTISEMQHETGRIVNVSGLDEPITGEVDPNRLRQVLFSLLSNAFKYSAPDQPVEVRAEVQPDDSGGRLRVMVHDRGRGIPVDHLPHIFERFYRIANADADMSTQEMDGLGVGLYIANNIIEQHGGHIWAESTVGRGSTFILELPLRRDTRAPALAEENSLRHEVAE
jgi:signal transduction histidine kinase